MKGRNREERMKKSELRESQRKVEQSDRQSDKQ